MVVEPQYLGQSGKAFSLIEILLVVALIGLVGGLVAINVNAIFAGLGERPLPEVFRFAVREARYIAARDKEPITLRFDAQRSAFIISDDSNAEQSVFETGYLPEENAVKVDFYQILPDVGINSGNILVSARYKISRIVFHPDRSSTPFEVELRYGVQTSTHRYDPFSDAELRGGVK